MMPRYNSILTQWPEPIQITATEEEPVEFGEPKENNRGSNDPETSGRYMSEDYWLERNPGKTAEDYKNSLLGISDSNQLGGERGSTEHEEEATNMAVKLGQDIQGSNYQGTGRKQRGTGDRARLESNLSQGQSSSILTG